MIDTLFASRLIDPKLAPRAIDAAFRIYMLPQGMFSVAVATVLFPSLSRLAARDDMPASARTVAIGLRQIAFLLIPAAVVSAVLAEPIVRLLYQRGAFEPDQTTVVAGALAAFSLGLTFNGAMLMLNRAFFSLQSPWTPTLVALGNLALNTALYAVLYRVGTWGIPLATSLANIAGAAAPARRAPPPRRPPRPARRPRARSRSSPSRRPRWRAVAYGVWCVLDEALGRSLAAQLVSLGAALVVGGAVYLVACRALGVRELEALLSLRDRFRRD